MKCLFVFLGILVLYSCQEENERIYPNYAPEFLGRYWTSEFYFYRNVYKFNTKDKGVCYENQIAGSCPIDLEKYNISEDSMLLMRELPFNYTYNDSMLSISFIPVDGDTIPERVFNIIEHSVGDFQLRSTYEYAYGHEVAYPESKWFQCCGDSAYSER